MPEVKSCSSEQTGVCMCVHVYIIEVLLPVLFAMKSLQVTVGSHGWKGVIIRDISRKFDVVRFILLSERNTVITQLILSGSIYYPILGKIS